MKFASSTRTVRLNTSTALGLLIVGSIMFVAAFSTKCVSEVGLMIIMVLLRVVGFICLPIIINSVSAIFKIIDSNQKVLQGYKSFAANCGDKLAQLDVAHID